MAKKTKPVNKNILEKKDILHLAKLAKLQLSDKEIEKYLNQLEKTVEYVKNLEELNTEKVNPTSQTTKSDNRFFVDGDKNQRLLKSEIALKNAKSKKGNYFVVKRIM